MIEHFDRATEPAMSAPETPRESEPPKSSRPAPKAQRNQERPPAAGSNAAFGVVLLALAGAVGIVVVMRAPIDSRSTRSESSASASQSARSPAPPPSRCERVASFAGHRVGRTAPADADADVDLPAAFGAEVSRAASLDSPDGPKGFAVGVRQDNGQGATGSVLTLGPGGESPTTHDLGRSRGDFDAPLVIAHPRGWLAGMLEPNAAGLSLRLSLGGQGSPKTGAEVEQARDESLAIDLATNTKAVVAAWDDVTEDGKRSRVLWAVLGADGQKITRKAEAASGKGVDADTPRFATRGDGFWLAYLARKAIELPEKPDDAALDRHPKQERYAAEKIDPSWIEILPLDESGAALGPARAVTPATGHVLSFDIEAGADGSALIAWRDDDTPSGAHGGRVTLMSVNPSGGTQSQMVAEENVGSGVPALFPGWLAITDIAGRAELAPIAPDGTLQGELMLEPAIGNGSPLAARGDRLLIATTNGTAVDISLVDCKR
jgi:hypothetical protein